YNTSMNSPVKKNPGINLSADGESNPNPRAARPAIFHSRPLSKAGANIRCLFLILQTFFCFF
ncbi:hypothetical protein, partial [Luteirhabdus pelagi]|uniref:hypothetical protein n=1 Tax=Luteirhabdus pelagi TaxID=2792783 RepID=UPI001F29D584